MTVSELYSRYTIIPNLQEHQLRVASVAKLICDHLTVPVDTDRVVKACLLHDMGNIIKFNLSYFPEFLESEGLDYWQQVQNSFIAKYGNEQHHATELIAKETGVDETTLSYINAVGFSQAERLTQEPRLEMKLCCYADQRVGPHGVLSLKERLAEGKARYANHPHARSTEEFSRGAQALHTLEEQIFSRCSLRPEAVTDAAIRNLLTPLAQTELP